MKWRNELLALFCLIVFGALGVFYFRHWVVQKPFGIILFIGEGLTPSRLAAARIYAHGADSRLAFDEMEHVALLRNYSADFAVPDAAAAATAIATGVRTNNGTLGVDDSRKSIINILELARQNGRAVGLVTDGSLTHATSAAFFAHQSDANDERDIASQLVATDLLDVALGGGRADDRDLAADATNKGFGVVRTKTELSAVPAWRRSRVLGLFAKGAMAYSDDVQSRGEQPSLREMVERAIELLQYNAAGYLLIVDAHLMGAAAASNDGERTLRETLELADAIDTARKFAGARSAWLVAGDVGIGGLALNGNPFRADSGVALLGLNARGEPTMTWATGPKGPRQTRLDAAATNPHNETDDDQDEPAAAYTEDALNTVDDVILLGSGIGTNRIHGVMENTEVFNLIRDNL